MSLTTSAVTVPISGVLWAIVNSTSTFCPSIVNEAMYVPASIGALSSIASPSKYTIDDTYASIRLLPV